MVALIAVVKTSPEVRSEVGSILSGFITALALRNIYNDRQVGHEGTRLIEYKQIIHQEMQCRTQL
jgi:hypothetical protein